MSLPPAAELERTLARSGDDLYRLALLLAPDARAADRALVRAVRGLAQSGAAPSEQALIAGLVAALPAEREYLRAPGALLRPPGWARAPAERASEAPLLRALARLPRAGRLALGLTLLRGFEPEQAAPLFGGDEAALRAQVRDALLALAPAATPDIPPDLLDAAQAPEACRSTRAALALGVTALHGDTAVRGHLALCATCRAAEQAWLKLTTTVETALRAALRPLHLPAALAEDLREAALPAPAHARRTWLDHPRVRIALVALPVLALIAFLVFPRGAPSSQTRGGATAGAPGDPRELVRRAAAQIYTTPDGAGVWHSHYSIQWYFPDGTLAPLSGDVWLDASGGRHRVQLTHQAGGGPYEFELADGSERAWYAVSEAYAPTLYPLSADKDLLRVRVKASPQQQQAMLQARLQAGAWSLPGSYLRAAAAADLHTWGRQRDADGRLIDLVSFSGASPLALPPDAPGATVGQVTILLAIEAESGRLREVRELVGAAGSEQTARTTWRLDREERVADAEAANAIFDQPRAWNGVGSFVERGPLVDPAFPLVAGRDTVPLAQGVQRDWTGIWMPAQPPPGATAAVLVNPGRGPLNVNEYFYNEQLVFVYLGGNRRLELRTTNLALETTSGRPGGPLKGAERMTINGAQVSLASTAAQGYQVQIVRTGRFNNPFITEVSARGYTRAEMIAFLQTLGPPTVDAYRAQARLFADTHPRGDAFDALLGALAQPGMANGSARHTVERVFVRHNLAPDRLTDPYHRPYYDGAPEHVNVETWARTKPVSGTLETVRITRDDGGATYWREFNGAGLSWHYNAPLNQIEQYSGAIDASALNFPEQSTILNMLACGGAEIVAQPDGARTVVAREQNWRNASCLRPFYRNISDSQPADIYDRQGDPGPYLADIKDNSLTITLNLGADGRYHGERVWAGAPDSEILLESRDLVSEDLVPKADIPPAAFDPTPPDALIRWQTTDNVEIGPGFTHPVSITEALRLAQTPLFGLPAAIDGAAASAGLTGTLDLLEASTLPDGPHPFVFFDDPFQTALINGYAVRLSYLLNDQSGSLHLYEGRADTLSAFLRATTRWRRSEPVTMNVGGRQVNGWQTLTSQYHNLTLFEIDGTLIAAQFDNAEGTPVVLPANAVAELRRLEAGGETTR